MSIEAELKRLAEAYAGEGEQRAARHSKRIRELEGELAAERAALETAQRSPQRLRDYPARIGRDYACPYCWLEGRETALRPINAQGEGVDSFTCAERHQLDVPFGL